MSKTEISPVKFVPVVADFNPLADIEEVDQFGWLDLRQAFLTGTVEGSLAPEDASYNGIDDPSSLLGAPKDTFEAIRQANAVAKASSVKSAAAAAAPTEGGSASSAAAE